MPNPSKSAGQLEEMQETCQNRAAMKISLLITCCFLTTVSVAQPKPIAHFSVWQPKPGLEKQFDSGYQQHLQWHARHKDPWSWYGWYVISGPRVGYFIDATFDHLWSDFDHPVNPAGDAADNTLHTEPYADFKLSYKLRFRKDRSIYDSQSLRSKFIRHITLVSKEHRTADYRIETIRSFFERRQLNNLLVYELVDGGAFNQWELLIGADSFATLGIVEELIRNILQPDTPETSTGFRSLTSETWRYRPDMSLFPR